MILRIEGTGITKEDLLAIGRFLATHFANRKDIIQVIIDGPELKAKECEELLNKIFEGKEHFVTKVKI